VSWTRKRVGIDGRPRYEARYRDAAGRVRGAGTFSSKKQAEAAGAQAELLLAQGRLGGADTGKLSFRRYVDEIWFPNHVLEPSTRESYRYVLDKHLMPTFGDMRMNAILPSHVREWVTTQVGRGVSSATIRHSKIVLSAIFTTALNDLVTVLHPCKGVKTPTVPVKEFRILTPEQFERLYAALPTPQARLLVETAIDSGLRWGELTELRVKDLDLTSRILTVSRAVVQLDPKFHPTGGRFHVKGYPKNRLARRLKLSPGIVAQITDLIAADNLGPDDLLFRMTALPSPAPVLRLVEDTDPDLIAAWPNGREYTHGTLTGYTAGRCRCTRCRGAFAQYRATRRAQGKDEPRATREVDTDGHIPRDWFSRRIWKPAVTAAGLEPVRLHDLRHAHASWLLAGGADLQVVKERLGHASIATTERYLHTLPGADETALDALAVVRQSARRPTSA
jgi:integrase